MPARPTQVGEKKGYHGWLRSSSREDGRFFHHPTRLHLEETVAALEEGAEAVAFASGMAAIAAVFELLSPGDHVICSEDLYGGTTRYLNNVSSKNGVAVEFADTTEIANVKAALRPQTRALVSTWRSSAHMLYSNWLNYFVYQITPYDLALIGGTCPPNTPTCPEDEEQCPYFSADMRQCTLEKQPKKAPGGA